MDAFILINYSVEMQHVEKREKQVIWQENISANKLFCNDPTVRNNIDNKGLKIFNRPADSIQKIPNPL